MGLVVHKVARTVASPDVWVAERDVHDLGRQSIDRHLHRIGMYYIKALSVFIRYPNSLPTHINI